LVFFPLSWFAEPLAFSDPVLSVAGGPVDFSVRVDERLVDVSSHSGSWGPCSSAFLPEEGIRARGSGVMSSLG
jgi:hypothetical protein